MKIKHTNRVSIVIPVYNEAAYLPACLDAISRQSVQPYEVIVVDNNSTDGTAAIARSYPFVKVLHESRQGVVFARDKGFNAVRGDIIGRIDADTIIDASWVETLQAIMNNPSVDVVSGSATYYDMALTPIINSIDLGIRRYLAFALKDEVTLQGANMGLRRSVWLKVRNEMCQTTGMHEDFDIAIHSRHCGFNVVFDESLAVSLGYRLVESSFIDYARYVFLSPKTYFLHNRLRGYFLYPVVGLALFGYIPLKILHQGYDSATRQFSWQAVFSSAPKPRVNPATYVG